MNRTYSNVYTFHLRCILGANWIIHALAWAIQGKRPAVRLHLNLYFILRIINIFVFLLIILNVYLCGLMSTYNAFSARIHQIRMTKCGAKCIFFIVYFVFISRQRKLHLKAHIRHRNLN